MKLLDKLLGRNKYRNECVYLKEDYRTDEITSYDGVPTIYYKIYSKDNKTRVGSIELRLTVEGDNIYYGHIGYNIIKKHRGHHYAYYACLLIFEIAKIEFKLKQLIITCSPDNIASYKTLQKLGGEIQGLLDVPVGHTLYILGEKQKYIFKYSLD